MTAWVIRQFRGMAPRVSPLLLAENMSQSASNAILKYGTLRARSANAAVMTLPKSGTIKTIHRFGQDTASDSQYWFHWGADVDVVRGPVFGDVAERTYFTDGTLPRVTDSSIALTGGTQYPMASYALGVPAPADLDIPVATVGGTPLSATALKETRVYIVTFVTAWGEEGSPSKPSFPVDVQVGETVALTLPSVPEGPYNFASKRIYRTATGSASTDYLYVGEVPHTATGIVDAVDASGVEVVVTQTFTGIYTLIGGLGEVLSSLNFFAPPPTLKGLTSGAGGTMAGFVGKDVYFCEPYKPYAWPVGYSQTVDSEIVGIGAFDTTWAVLTKTVPYIISGSHPDNYTMIKSESNEACLSKRSIVHVGGGVVYASPNGLFLISGSGSRNLTEALMTKVEWANYHPDTIEGYVYDDCYIGFYNGTAGFVLDLKTGDFSTLNWYASAGQYDPARNALFLVTSSNHLVKFCASTTSATMSWKSKQFDSPHPINQGAAKVEATIYPVTLKVWADYVLRHTQTVEDNSAFRLPSGFLANVWEMEVTATDEVLSLSLAGAMDELKRG